MAEKKKSEHAHYEDEFLYDTRLIERHLTHGLITHQSTDKRLAGLSDCAHNAQSIDLDQLAAIASGRRTER